MTMDSHQEHQPLPEKKSLNVVSSEKKDDYESDEEDTLSLTDLTMDRLNFSPDPYQYSPNAPSKNQDFFEFFSEERSMTTKPSAAASISPEIVNFSGKKSPPRNPVSRSKSTQKQKIHEKQKQNKSRSPYGSRNSSSGSKGINTNEGLETKMSIFTSPVKLKWLLVLLGLPPQIPDNEVILKNDIKNRQSRHAPSTFFPSNSGGGAVEEAADRRKSEKGGLWRLTSCFGSSVDDDM